MADENNEQKGNVDKNQDEVDENLYPQKRKKRKKRPYYASDTQKGIKKRRRKEETNRGLAKRAKTAHKNKKNSSKNDKPVKKEAVNNTSAETSTTSETTDASLPIDEIPIATITIHAAKDPSKITLTTNKITSNLPYEIYTIEHNGKKSSILPIPQNHEFKYVDSDGKEVKNPNIYKGEKLFLELNGKKTDISDYVKQKDVDEKTIKTALKAYKKEIQKEIRGNKKNLEDGKKQLKNTHKGPLKTEEKIKKLKKKIQRLEKAEHSFFKRLINGGKANIITKKALLKIELGVKELQLNKQKESEKQTLEKITNLANKKEELAENIAKMKKQFQSRQQLTTSFSRKRAERRNRSNSR